MIFCRKLLLLEQLCIHISCLRNCHFYSLLLCKASHCFLSSEDYFLNSSDSILWIGISSLLFISCSQWHRKGYTMLFMKDISVVSPSSGVQSISNNWFHPESPGFHCYCTYCNVSCNHLPEGVALVSSLNHLSYISVDILVTSPISWLLFPMRNQPLQTSLLWIWNSDFQCVKAWNLFISLLIYLIPNISNWICDTSCRLFFLYPASIFVFGIGRSSRKTDSMQRPVIYFHNLLHLFTLSRIHTTR